MFLFIPFIFLFVEARLESLLEYFMVEGSVRLAASFRFFCITLLVRSPVYLSKGKITSILLNFFFSLLKGEGGGVVRNQSDKLSNPLNFFPP